MYHSSPGAEAAAAEVAVDLEAHWNALWARKLEREAAEAAEARAGELQSPLSDAQLGAATGEKLSGTAGLGGGGADPGAGPARQ